VETVREGRGRENGKRGEVMGGEQIFLSVPDSKSSRVPG